MPTPSQQRILTALDSSQGNVKVVAEDLGVSVSLVNRVKKGMWQPPDTAPSPLVPLQNKQLERVKEEIRDVLPTNFAAVASLRDEAIAKLRELVRENLVDAKDLTAIASAILRYEREVHKVVAPAFGIFQDNRQVHFNGLVDKLGDLSPDALRALTGTPEPMVIDIKSEAE